MDEQTAVVLALQLVALCCVAAALLMYLLCRIKGGGASGASAAEAAGGGDQGQGRAVLVTCCDSALGLQVALRLSLLGFRVLAGSKAPDDSDGAKVLRAKMKEREMLQAPAASPTPACGSLVVIPLDVTREDLLHEAVGLIRSHLPAGEDGLWAVVNTAGLCYRGRLDQQENAHWDAILKHNVIGTLRTARTFMPLLRNKKGRLVNIGIDVSSPAGMKTGLVAYTAARYAVEGASMALRQEVAPYGVNVITLQPEGLSTERLYGAPSIGVATECADPEHTVLDVQSSQDKYVECDMNVLPPEAMVVVEEVLLSKTPKERYHLLPHTSLGKLTKSITDITNRIRCACNKPLA